MIGLRVGVVVGPRVGVAVGVSEDQISTGGAVVATTTLAITIADSVDPVISTVNFTYSVVVTNTGAATATSVSAVIVLDATLTFVSGIGTDWDVNAIGQVVTCTRDTLVVGAAPTIAIVVTTANAASTETTTADVSASNAPAATQDVETTVVKLVARDTGSLIRVPASLTQWQDFNAYQVAIGTPNYPNVTPTCLWLCQEASGNLADSIGSVTLTLAGTGHLFQQAVTGWTRVAVKTVDGTASQKWVNSTTAPNPSSTSTNWLAYISFPAAAPASARDLMANSSALDCRLSSSGKLTAINGASTAGTANPLNGVHIVEIKHDITNTVFAGFSDQEKIAGTFATITSNTIFAVGGQTTTASGSAYLYVAEFSGAAAELSDAQIKARQTALGWVPLW